MSFDERFQSVVGPRRGSVRPPALTDAELDSLFEQMLSGSDVSPGLARLRQVRESNGDPDDISVLKATIGEAAAHIDLDANPFSVGMAVLGGMRRGGDGGRF